MTLPEDVVAWLHSINPDPAWAVVRLFERAERLGRKAVASRPVADLVPLPRNRSLILVQPDLLAHVQGVAVIPLADGRGFLALEPGKGLADLELALLDRIESRACQEQERAGLTAMRETIRGWRQSGLRFTERAILVAERRTAADSQPLAQLAEVS